MKESSESADADGRQAKGQASSLNYEVSYTNPEALVASALELAFRGVNPRLGLAEREAKATNVARFVLQQLRTTFDVQLIERDQ